VREEEHEVLWRILRRVLGCALLVGLLDPLPLRAAPLFGEARSYPVGTSPVGIVTGEFSATSGLDLATADEGNTLTILENQGNGVFLRGTQLGLDERYISTAITRANLNDDGITDLAISVDDVQSFPGFNGAIIAFPSIEVFRYSQIPSMVAEFPTCVVYGDLTGDQLDDLAACTTEETGGTLIGVISLLRRLPDDTFADAQSIPIGNVIPSSLLVDDIDGDTRPDMIVVEADGNEVSVFFGTGDGPTFGAPVSLGSINGPQSAVAAHLNDDSLLDIVVVARNSARAVAFLQTAPRTFALGVPAAAGLFPVDLAVGHFDQDDHVDLAVVNSGSSDVSVLLGNGDGTFRAQETIAVGNGPVAIVAGDFNGDGKLDFATANQDDETFGRDVQSVSVVLNGVTPPFTPTVTQTHTRTPTGTRPTVTLTPTATRTGTRATPTSTPTMGTPLPTPTPAGPADVNCDGRVDEEDVLTVVHRIFDGTAGCIVGEVTAADLPRIIQLIAAD
jgi:hypothetical protein